MAITFVKERKKQKYLVLIALVMIGVAFLVLWSGYFRKEELASSPTLVAPSYKEIKINFEVFENPFLKEVQPFEKTSPFEDGMGRINPFLPY